MVAALNALTPAIGASPVMSFDHVLKGGGTVPDGLIAALKKMRGSDDTRFTLYQKDEKSESAVYYIAAEAKDGGVAYYTYNSKTQTLETGANAAIVDGMRMLQPKGAPEKPLKAKPAKKKGSKIDRAADGLFKFFNTVTGENKKLKEPDPVPVRRVAQFTLSDDR